jgi:hypothetical protein
VFTRVWGVLLAFRYVFTNLVKYRYAEGHVFAAAAPKGGVFSEPIQGNSSRRNRLVKAKSPKGGVFSEPVQGNSSRQNTPLQGEIAWRPSRQNRLAPFKAKSPGALAWGCRVRLEQLACRPLAPIWGRCSLRRRALTAVARVGVRSANDSERTLDDLIDDSTGIHLMAETEVCQLKPSWPHTLCTSGRGSGVDLSEGSGSGSG